MELRRVSKSVTKQQFETLIKIMEENRYLAENKMCKAFTKNDRKRKWEEIATHLNSLGGAVKTVEKWAKCWSDKKNDTRKKASKILANLNNGGPPTEEKLSALDERVLELSTWATGNGDKNSEENSMEGTYTSVADEEMDMSNTYITPTFVTSIPVITSMSSNHNNTPPAPRAEPNEILPTINEEPPIILTSEDVPTLIKVEPPDEEEQSEEASPPAPFSPPDDVQKPPPTPRPQLSASSNIGLRNLNPRKARNRCCRSKFMTAERAAESFVSISQRNCDVLERIANAMEVQATESAKQTQLMLELVEVLKKR